MTWEKKLAAYRRLLDAAGNDSRIVEDSIMAVSRNKPSGDPPNFHETLREIRARVPQPGRRENAA